MNLSNLAKYLTELKNETGVEIIYHILSDGRPLFDINNNNSIFHKHNIEILYNSIYGKEGFEVNLSAKQFKEEGLSEYLKSLKKVNDIICLLNEFLDFYFSPSDIIKEEEYELADDDTFTATAMPIDFDCNFFS